MLRRLAYLNDAWQGQSLGQRNDGLLAALYHDVMADPRHDWYLKQWLRTLGKRQEDVARDLEMNKAKISLMARGKQQYTRDAVNAIADYLNLRPYELLMHPDDAMRLRRLREDAIRIAHEAESAEISEPEKKVRNCTTSQRRAI